MLKYSMNFIISEKSGLKYSKKSGDKNQIHLDNLVGYNSIFGTKICHGTLVITKSFRLLNINKNLKDLKEYNINIKFQKNFLYKKKIYIRKNPIKIFQKKQGLASIKITNTNNLENYQLSKKYTSKVNRKKYKLTNKKNHLKFISFLLDNLSRYVGMIYPGENSIIINISINFNENFNYSNNEIIYY